MEMWAVKIDLKVLLKKQWHFSALSHTTFLYYFISTFDAHESMRYESTSLFNVIDDKLIRGVGALLIYFSTQVSFW
jgi:hypothetical protein